MSSQKHSIQIRHGQGLADDAVDDLSSSHPKLLPIPATAVLQLILAHLTEHGLHESVKTIQNEAKIGMAGTFVSNWEHLASTGSWDALLRAISVLDASKISNTLRSTVYEHIILELADDGEWETAYAIYRVFQKQRQDDSNIEHQPSKRAKSNLRSLDSRLADLAAQRAKDTKFRVDEKEYYGGDKMERRKIIGQQLHEAVPKQPPQRLVDLLQQALKWQSYTGQLPRHGDETAFDLVLGEVESGSIVPVGEAVVNHRKKKLIKKEGATIKFGKRATCESTAFLPDGTGIVTGSSDGLVEVWDVCTGKPIPRQADNEEDVIMAHDTPVTAAAVSNDATLIATGGTDGIVNVWRTETGKHLRQLETKAFVASLAFHPMGDRVLVAGKDGSCREYGLRGAKMLQEFVASSSDTVSYLTQCQYTQWSSTALKGSSESRNSAHEYDGDAILLVTTAHGDGTARLWDASTASCVRLLQPVASGKTKRLPSIGSSVIASEQALATGPAMISIFCLHTPAHTLLLVPRDVRAFLVEASGTILRIFDMPVDTSGGTIAPAVIAATVSSCNRWLYAATESGACHIFDITTGESERTLSNFGSNSTTGITIDPSDQTSEALRSTTKRVELSSISYHPNKDFIAAFSNDKRQRKGKVVLWR